MTETDRVIYGFMSESASIGRGEFESLSEEFKETMRYCVNREDSPVWRKELAE